MKKLTIILIIVTVLCCSFAFVGCNKEKPSQDTNPEIGENAGQDKITLSEAFVGAVSKTIYDNKEDALKGFIEEEISSDAFTSEYVGYTKIADLSKKEIDELDLDKDTKASIVSVEKGEVEYIDQSNYEEESLRKVVSDTVKRSIYIAICNKDGKTSYRYYAPVSEVGERLSASEINSILDDSKYFNSTVRIDFKRHDIYYLIGKFADTAIYSGAFFKLEGEYVVGDEFYITSFENVVYDITKYGVGGEWYADKVKRPTIEDEISYLIKEWFFDLFETFDYPYYIKSKQGCDVYDGNELCANIVIEKGKITEMDILDDYGDYDAKKVKFYDFGTTKIDIPNDVKKAIDEYNSNNQ